IANTVDEKHFAAPINAITGMQTTCPVVTGLILKANVAKRQSGTAKEGFIRPGERAKCVLDSNNNPYPIENEPHPQWPGSPSSGRVPSDDEKCGTWWLQEEYLANRLGKNTEENSRLWNTVKWIDKHFRIATTPAEANSPLNIYVGDKTSQATGAPTGDDDEAP